MKPQCDNSFGPIEDEYDEFTINEIINGTKDGSFPGLMGVVHKYLDSLDVRADVRKKLDESLELIRRRADGEHANDLYRESRS